MPAGIPSYEEDPYSYSLSFDNGKSDKHGGSYCCHSFRDCTYWELCEFLEWVECVEHHHETMAKFRLAMDAMEAAHCESNDQKLDLLASIHNVFSLAHKLGKNKSLLEKSITLAWQVPDWLPMTC